MTTQWFRLYTDLPECPKLRRLKADVQLAYVWFLCLHKQGFLVGAPTKDIAWRLRIKVSEVERYLATLTEEKLLNEDRTPKGWEERQFTSDLSTERSRRSRCRNVAATLQQRPGNGGATPRARSEQSRADSDTETDAAAASRARDGDTAAAAASLDATAEWDTARYVEAFRNMVPTWKAVPVEAVLAALKAEPDPEHRAMAWKDFAAAALGAVEPIRNPVAMLRGYMRQARGGTEAAVTLPARDYRDGEVTR